MKVLLMLKEKIAFKTMTTSRITILGMLLALMIALKYALGFIPGIELISFMFIFLGIFLPILDLILLVSSFNLLILALYGFGSWWIVYWIIWPIDAFVSKILSKITRNYYVFSAWGFLAGFSVFFWYFLADLIMFDSSYAILNLITALPINLIEGLTTMIAFIIIAPSLAKVFNIYQNKIYDQKAPWNFKMLKQPKLNLILAILFLIIALGGILLLVIYNQTFIDWKTALLGDSFTNDLAGDGSAGNFTPTK